MLKRAIPFIITFVLGLAIASIFVSIVPSFNFRRGDRGKNCRNKHEAIHELKRENEMLRFENRNLKSQPIREIPYSELDEMMFENSVPPPMPVEPRRNR